MTQLNRANLLAWQQRRLAAFRTLLGVMPQLRAALAADSTLADARFGIGVIEYFKANGILSEDSHDLMQQTCSKLMADLDRVCWRADFPAVAETLLQKFDVLTRLSELDPRRGH